VSRSPPQRRRPRRRSRRSNERRETPALVRGAIQGRRFAHRANEVAWPPIARWTDSSPERGAVQGRCRAQRGGGVVLRRQALIAPASTERGVLARRSPSAAVRPLRRLASLDASSLESRGISGEEFRRPPHLVLAQCGTSLIALRFHAGTRTTIGPLPTISHWHERRLFRCRPGASSTRSSSDSVASVSWSMPCST
jgi:hypothetical protein